jgi:murein DD-endopeptidase MepM/ murein hydrolase activator NlpD
MSVRYRLFVLFIFSVLLGAYAQNADHVMQRGETIYSIARSYGVSVEDILTLNGITDPTRVQAGQRISIPRGTGTVESSGTVTPAASVSAGYVQHQVVRGEALYGIARQYGTTVQDLRAVNNLAEDYVLKAGDWLRIPLSASALVPPAGTSAPAVTPVAPAAGTSAAVRSTEARAVDGSVLWPVNAKEVRYMTGKLSGVMILGELAEPVKSLTQGTVVSAGPYRGFGRVVIVQMTGGYLYVYGGCEILSVKEGDRVVPGTELGKLGIDGVTSKPQLFFLVYRSNNPVDPAKAPRA